MRPFAYERAQAPDAAVALAALDAPGSATGLEPTQYLAGGTNLVDYMKLDVMRPDRLVDINDLERRFGQIEPRADGLRLGALVRMSAAERHPVILADWPLIAQSLQQAASAQLRNMASLGGNVLQRTRCSYFRDVSYAACNKRAPGSGCSAIDGYNRKHAVLGTSEACIATYPSDFAQALAALGAQVELIGPRGRRTIPFEDLHRAYGESPNVETTLQPGELIAAFDVPAGPWTRRSLYLKVRDRQSYDFALASAAVALDMDGERVREARIALGGLATRPWRAHAAEAELRGKPLDDRTAARAADAEFAQARSWSCNGFKVELGKRTLVRALVSAAQMDV